MQEFQVRAEYLLKFWKIHQRAQCWNGFRR